MVITCMRERDGSERDGRRERRQPIRDESREGVNHRKEQKAIRGVRREGNARKTPSPEPYQGKAAIALSAAALSAAAFSAAALSAAAFKAAASYHLF